MMLRLASTDTEISHFSIISCFAVVNNYHASTGKLVSESSECQRICAPRPISVGLSEPCFAFSVLTLLVRWQEGHPACKNLSDDGTGMAICLGRGADLHMAQLMPLPITNTVTYNTYSMPIIKRNFNDRTALQNTSKQHSFYQNVTCQSFHIQN